ncbi:L-glyceraldehyde 3-phosphate reductase [Mongoliitalea daihaiensis]|uniref:L-glyceraldehyde 3-phosphate reductase n=1 Tax=Mongoliitalea daihaiensis TaxID=2782006 RepID=UPI001F318A02|nr:L-glyceraldehyde 3-phosphate reductase [Mongoliitalea daihaiensis]UJP63897.1 L-glyceraldehyde 3-phosphate reductase [Mongoliitalea daihaiensis]
MKINDHHPLPTYVANENRYERMQFRRCGKSGLQLPMLSLGLWHNFGHNGSFTTMRQIIRTAFDGGITHIDLANNYGPPFGSAEENFGRILHKDLKAYRDELIISSKAGWDMWPGPYGNFGSKKYLIASLDQSLKRMNLDYLDIFYHHRPDPDTPLEETMEALALMVKQGKALYVGISQYTAEQTIQAYEILQRMGVRLLIHQPRYSMLDRWVENDLLLTLSNKGIGGIAFSPLEQGLLTDKYLNGIPAGSRIASDGRYLSENNLTPQVLEKVRLLNEIAQSRGQKLAQMAIAWILRNPEICSVLIGVSTSQQVEENIQTLQNLQFTESELQAIEAIIQ